MLAALASVHFGKGLVLMEITSSVMCLGVAFGHEVMFEELCAIASDDLIADSRRQARNYKQWAVADLFSISCYVRPIR